MTELLKRRHFKAAPLEMAPQRHLQRRSVAAVLLHHSHPTIYLLPEFEANWLKNDRVTEWVPFQRWRRRKWRPGAMYGAKALRRRCYIIPHPTIYLVLEFEANRLKNDRVIEWAPF